MYSSIANESLKTIDICYLKVKDDPHKIIFIQFILYSIQFIKSIVANNIPNINPPK